MYVSGGRVFQTLDEACAYANFIFKISGFIVAVEKFN
jgi:hypothetical protein